MKITHEFYPDGSLLISFWVYKKRWWRRSGRWVRVDEVFGL
jgi:hypothetical protein